MNALNCLFQDANIYAIHKPEGVPFHSLDEVSNKDDQLVHVEGVISLAKKLLNDESIYPVHRLDRMTSGVIIFARSKEVNSALSKLFTEKKIEKYYLALSQEKPKKKQGAIVGDMAKGRSGSYLLKRSHENPAITRFFAKKITIKEGDAWFFVMKPETGKTHQLRVALKSLGSPVLGDTRYSGKAASRGYLHAYQVRFKLLGVCYDIIDPYFEGDEFMLSQLQTLKISELKEATNDSPSYLRPELLSWPKSCYRLKVES